MDRRALAAHWEDGISPAVGGLQDGLKAQGLNLDYSFDSLRAVEALTRNLFGTPGQVLAPEERSLVQALMGYIGLTLVHLTGGRWDWDDEPGFATRTHPPLSDPALAEPITNPGWAWPDGPAQAQPGIPIAVPGAELDLQPVSPLHLLLATAAESPTNDTGPCARTYTEWSAKVTTPPKAGVPGIDVFDTPAASTELDTWLSERRQQFPAWAHHYPGPWDYSPDSIDALTEVALKLIRTTEEFNAPANADFVDGASWYLGEVLCRSVGARWVHRPHMAARDGSPAVAGYQVQINDDADTTSPFRLLRLSITTKEPEARVLHDDWLDHVKGGHSRLSG
jgi:hypothetical protein